MSIIEGIGPYASSMLANRARRAGGAPFMLDHTAQPERAGAAKTTAPVLTGMLTLQETELEPLQDRAARRHGRALLTALTDLQRQLLGGGDCAAALDELTALNAGVPYASDPELAAALRAIVLRTRVELARHGR